MASKYYDERGKRDPEPETPASDDLESQASAPEREESLDALTDDVESESGAADVPQAPTRRRPRPKKARRQQTDANNVTDLDAGDDETEEGSELIELTEKGFTAEEAIRLVHVSHRAAVSREAREAEQTLRRLRFTRWLIEHGMLDEFSA